MHLHYPDKRVKRIRPRTRDDVAKEHGIPGIPSESEWRPIARDVELIRETGCRYHVCHVSTKESVEIIRRAKAEGVNITAPSVNINLHRQKMGMVFQQFNLFPHKTVLKNMTLGPIKLLHQSRAEAEKHALELLERVGLADKANAYPNQLSGGQKQRVAIVRALCMDP